MQLRYRYRAYQSPGQEQLRARTCGCARVVFNDALRARQGAHAAGQRLGDTEVQPVVATLAKTTRQREWLAEVASVVLVRACQDVRRGYRNCFDSLSVKRKGRRVGRPRFGSRKDNRQVVRLTRNGLEVTAKGVRVAKVGDVALGWSRPLLSVPSSVSMIWEGDGRYYASLVVEVQDTPLSASTCDVGLDLGLGSLAVLSTGEVIANPRRLRSKARSLATAQRVLARKQKGSNNDKKAVRRVAAAHRRVRTTRLDAHHKLAAGLIRDNQAVYVQDLAVYVQDLAVSGLARTRLAMSVHDAGWAILVRLLKQKAYRCGRQVAAAGRWFPWSQPCCVCGHGCGAEPLDVRVWTCPDCDTVHDRDVNAAQNILVEGRRLAAGQADTVNACGGDVRQEPALAVAGGAGTRRGAA